VRCDVYANHPSFICRSCFELSTDLNRSARAGIDAADGQPNLELLIAACKHGAAVEAAVHAIRNEHMTVALEVVSHVGGA
jgi:hypothetical protein